MTVSSTTVSKSYKPGSAMAPEAIGFQFLDPTDIAVVHVAAATGVRTTLVPGTDYVIAGDAMAGTATITATAAWPADDDFIVTRETAMLQGTNLVPQEPLKAKALERQLDRLALIDQEQDARLGDVEGSALFAAPGEPGFNLPPKAGRANKVAVFSSIGTGATLVPINLTADQLAALAGQDVAIGTLAANIGALLAVNADLVNINIVAGDIALVHAVGASIANVNIVASGIGTLNAVVANAANINIVAGAAGNINTVAGGIANVATVAGGMANVATVAGDLNLGAGSKIKAIYDNLTATLAVGADLLLGAASKIAIVAADLALGAASLIGKAPQAAIDAAASALAAATSAASIPVGAGMLIIGNGLPANNEGSLGAYYLDRQTGTTYGPKSAAAWPLGTVTDVNAATPSRYKVDFTRAGAVLPAAHFTLSRTTSRTDMLYSDDYNYVPTTYGPGIPVIRAGKGLGVWQPAQQILQNPGAPAVETPTLNNTGVYIVCVWGPAGSSMGVAFGTGTGTITDASLIPASSIAGNVKSYLIITMTSTGTVIFTPSGGLTKANVTINPLAATLSQPVPYIPTQSTVNADLIAGTATFNAMIGAAKGYFMVGVSGLTGAKNYARLPSPLGLNNITAGYASADNAYVFYDVASHQIINNSTGTTAFSTGTTMARTWDTSQPTVTYGAGDYVERSFGFTHNNGVAVTASALGSAATTGTYAAYTQINGWITGYEIATEARIADEPFYNKYSATALPTLDALIKGYTSPSQFKKFLSAVRKMRAGVIDFVPIVINGPSHEAGYLGSPGPANVRSLAWHYQMVTDLIAQGVAITDDTFCGSNNYNDGAAGYTGTNQFDSRITYTGAAPTRTGRQIGGEVIVIPAGSTRTVTPSRGNTSRFILAVYTAAAGYGSVEVSIDGGATPLVAMETGLATNSTTAAAGLLKLTFNAPLGANSWTIKAVGNPVHVSYGQPYITGGKQIVVFNTARDNWKVADLARNNAPEDSHLLGITAIAPALVLGSSDQTNDMGGPTAYSSYSTSQNAIIANAAATADIVLFIDPRSNPATYSQTTQDTITNYARSIGADNGLALYDLFSWKTYALLAAMGFYSMTPGAGADNLHLNAQGLKRLKANQMGDLLKRILAAA